MDDFMIYPAIDLRRGQVVRLTQGDPNRQKTYSLDPLLIASQMLDDGAKWLHVVNLDAAFGEPAEVNLSVIQELAELAGSRDASIQVGGGFRDANLVKNAFKAGITRIIIGSLAVRDPEFVTNLLQEYSPDQIAVSLDGLNKKVMISGWLEETNAGVVETAQLLQNNGLRWLIYTDIHRDGMQSGSDFNSTIEIFRKTGLKVIASGGVSSLDEISLLKDNGIAGAIVGKALYEGTISLKELIMLQNKEDK